MGSVPLYGGPNLSMSSLVGCIQQKSPTVLPYKINTTTWQDNIKSPPFSILLQVTRAKKENGKRLGPFPPPLSALQPSSHLAPAAKEVTWGEIKMGYAGDAPVSKEGGVRLLGDRGLSRLPRPRFLTHPCRPMRISLHLCKDEVSGLEAVRHLGDSDDWRAGPNQASGFARQPGGGVAAGLRRGGGGKQAEAVGGSPLASVPVITRAIAAHWLELSTLTLFAVIQSYLAKGGEIGDRGDWLLLGTRRGREGEKGREEV